MGICVGGVGGYLAERLVGGVTLGGGEVGGMGVGCRLVRGDGRSGASVGLGVGVSGVVGIRVRGVGRDRRGDLGIPRDRGRDVRLGQRPGVVGIGVARVGGEGSAAAVASAAACISAWEEPACVASTVGAAHVPPSSPPGVVPTTISFDSSADAVPTR